MDNRFDHMEDSVRKAMEGFELPVNDQDWERISQALDTGRKRRGFWLFRKFLPLLLLLTVMTGTAIWMLNENDSDSRSVQVSRQPEKAGAKIGQTPAPPVSENNGIQNSGNAAGNRPGSQAGASAVDEGVAIQSPDKGISIAPQPALPPAPNAAVAATGHSENVSTGSGSAMQPQAGLQILPFGIRSVQQTWPSVQPVNITGVVPALLHFPKDARVVKTGWFADMHITSAAHNTTDLRNTPRWSDNAGLMPVIGSGHAFNIRMDAGLYADLGGWRFSGGLGLEGNPFPSTQDRTSTIRIATRFLPYFDSRGTLLYWLAVEWKDSVVKYKQSQQQVWTELPLQAERVLWRTKGIAVRAGLSFNPGVALLNRATTVNPYTAQSGSYWQYMLGRLPDTGSVTLESVEDLQRFRMGNGVSLGISGQRGNMGWGINVNTRYYYTDIWRSKYVPWQQRNLSYGIQFRLDWKF